MEIDEIVDYATNSPENTNPAVLRSMLSQLSGGGSGGGVFWVSVTSEDGQTFTADKTIDEIISAHNSGNLVMVNDQFDYQGVAPANCGSDSAYATVVHVDAEKHIAFVTIGITANLVTGRTDVSYDVARLQGT